MQSKDTPSPPITLTINLHLKDAQESILTEQTTKRTNIFLNPPEGPNFSLDFVEFEEFKSADLTLTCSLALIDGVFLGLVTFVPNKRKKVVLLKQIKDS